MSAAVDLILVALTLLLAGGTLAVREVRSAVIIFIGFGLLLGLVWVRLSSIDIALTEVAIGGAATGILLLRACTALRSEPASVLPGPGLRIVAGILCASVTVALGFVVLALPDPAPTLALKAAEHMPPTELENPVTVVLLVFRAVDTLLEKVVLLLALVGVWSLTTDRLWGGAPAAMNQAKVDGPLVLLARVLPAAGVVFGIYLVWNGADEPGGTFQGGAVLAGMWLLVQMAGLRPMPQTGSTRTRQLITFGPVVFLLVGLAGFFVADSFLAYPEGFAKPIIVAVEVALALSIAGIIAMLVVGPSAQARR